jgi:hypothetical protein
MFYLRKKSLFAFGLPGLLVLAAVNHGFDYSRQQAQKREKAQPQVVVRMENSSLGHNSIGIDESSATGNAGPTLLHFITLADWKYDPKTALPCPAAIRQFSGHEVNCVGFMYPLTAGTMVKVFCLLRSTQTCCYGPRPQYNQYLLIECKEPVKFERLAPVMVQGRFQVDPQPDQGFIYRMEAATVQRIGEETPEVNAPAEARKAHLLLFSFSILAGLKHAASVPISLPIELLALEGKPVVVEGYCVRRFPGKLPGLMISRDWWDGVSQGKRPTLYNAMLVFPRDITQYPPLWQPHCVFTGVLQVTRDSRLWQREGIVSLHAAGIGIAGNPLRLVLNSGPWLPLADEVVLFSLFLLYTVRWKRKVSNPVPGEAEGKK